MDTLRQQLLSKQGSSAAARELRSAGATNPQAQHDAVTNTRRLYTSISVDLDALPISGGPVCDRPVPDGLISKGPILERPASDRPVPETPPFDKAPIPGRPISDGLLSGDGGSASTGGSARPTSVRQAQDGALAHSIEFLKDGGAGG